MLLPDTRIGRNKARINLVPTEKIKCSARNKVRLIYIPTLQNAQGNSIFVATWFNMRFVSCLNHFSGDGPRVRRDHNVVTLPWGWAQGAA